MALIVILTAPLLYVIDIFIINMAIPGIKKGIHATDGEVQLVIAGYLLGSASFLITGGRAGDYLGRKKVFFWGMFFFTMTSCLCGLSQTALELNITRFFQGMSSSFMVPQSIAFIQVLFTAPTERAKAIGWYGITLSIAAIIGQILGGYLVDTHFFIAGWRLIFFINLPVGILALWAIHRYLKETPRDTSQRFDYSGALILTAGLVCLIYPLTKGREMGWPLWSIGLMLLSLFIFAFFIRNQQMKVTLRKDSLIDTALFQDPGIQYRPAGGAISLHDAYRISADERHLFTEWAGIFRAGLWPRIYPACRAVYDIFYIGVAADCEVW